VKLLLDQNLSPRLVGSLSDVFPDSAHVRDLGLARADDAAIWDYARENELTIVSKDSDFHQLSFLRGSPPKVIWIRRGNCSTADIEGLLRSRRKEILEFGSELEPAFLALS
jgi:predicted nuclease of predicted toxin-antitoxin system